MPTLVFAGLTRDMKGRVRRVLGDLFENWIIIYAASDKTNKCKISTGDIELILAAARDADGGHVVGFSMEEKSLRENIADEIKKYFRFRWFGEYHLRKVGQNEFGDDCFVNEVKKVIGEENLWIKHVKPKSHGDALLLPKGSFGCSGEYARLWELSESYNDEEVIRSVERKIDSFKKRFHNLTPSSRSLWTDEEGRVFQYATSERNTAPFPRSWKYSYGIGNLHYRVVHLNGSYFYLEVAGGSRRASIAPGNVRPYFDIDPHGCAV